jgi:type IV pilus assembly protein PilM
MPAVAIDIGTYSVKAIAANPGEKPDIKRIVEVFNTTGMAVPSDEAAVEKMSALIDSVFTDYDLPRTDVRIALPETIVSTKVIPLPPLSDAELASAINWQAEQHIPIPPEELALEYQVLFRPGRNDKQPMRVLLVGLRKTVIDNYVNLFHNLGVEPSLIETQVISIMRSLQFVPQDPTTLIVHIGASSMNMALVHQAELKFVLSHLNGGQLLTKALEQTLAMDSTQSEQYKRTYGLDQAQFQGKVREAMLPAARLLVTEVKKALQFFVNQNPQDSVKRIVLSGGTAVLPGLVQYVTEETGCEVLVSAPFTNATGEIPQQINQPSMTVCMGLLSRSLS